LITDILEEGSEILYYGPGAPLLEKALGLSQGNWRAFLPGVVSRKKQMIPPLRRALQFIPR